LLEMLPDLPARQ